MKRILFIVILCAVSTGVWGQRVKLESGMLIFLNNEKHLDIKFTYDSLKVGKLTETAYLDKKVSEMNKQNPGSGDKFRQSWVSERETHFEPKFREFFYKVMKEKGIASGGEGTYSLIVNVFFIEPGASSANSHKAASVSAMATFINNQTGGTAATLVITNSPGQNVEGADFDMITYRLQTAYSKAGEALAKFLIAKSRW